LHDGLSDFEAAAGLDADARGDAVPATQLREGHSEAVGDGDQGISAAHGVEACACGGGGLEGHGNDEGFDSSERLIGSELVCGGQLGCGDLEFAGHGFERVTGHERVVAPAFPLVFGDGGDLLLEARCGASGEMEIKGSLGRRDHAEEAWVESLQLIDGCTDKVRDQPEVYGVIDRYGVSEDRRVEGDVIEAVLLGIVGDDDGG